MFITNHKLDDKEIRSVLLRNFSYRNLKREDTIVIEELDLCQGEARIDLAIINGVAKGIEIKSDKDTLDRLEYQASIYNKVFDFVEVVVGKTHQATIFKKIPEWWGVSIVECDKNSIISYKSIRNGEKNNCKDPMCTLQFLWKEEALSILNKKNQFISNKKLPRYKIWEKILEAYQEYEIYNLVYHCLRVRQNWRHVHQLSSNGD